MEIQIAFWIMVGIKACELLQRIADLEQEVKDVNAKAKKRFATLAKRTVRAERRTDELEIVVAQLMNPKGRYDIELDIRPRH